MLFRSLSRYDYFVQDPDFLAVLIIGTLFLGAFFGFLNETLLNVALTHIMHYFSIDKSTVQWMTTGFLLIIGALTPITANVIQWFSTRTTALLILGIFLTGTVICAFVPSFPVHLLRTSCGRAAIQGLLRHIHALRVSYCHRHSQR